MLAVLDFRNAVSPGCTALLVPFLCVLATPPVVDPEEEFHPQRSDPSGCPGKILITEKSLW